VGGEKEGDHECHEGHEWGMKVFLGQDWEEAHTKALGHEGLRARSSPELSCPFFAKATKGLLSEKGLALLGGGTGPNSYLPFFGDFVTGERRKSLGNGVFLVGWGIRCR
jgi:hypothetical protein